MKWTSLEQLRVQVYVVRIEVGMRLVIRTASEQHKEGDSHASWSMTAEPWASTTTSRGSSSAATAAKSPSWETSVI